MRRVAAMKLNRIMLWDGLYVCAKFGAIGGLFSGPILGPKI